MIIAHGMHSVPTPQAPMNVTVLKAMKGMALNVKVGNCFVP